jgi:hypothetical protein
MTSMDTGKVNIKGVDKAELLAVLRNHSRPMGMGFLQDTGRELTVDEARGLIEQAQKGARSDDHGRMFGLKSRDSLYFDYLHGRPLKVDIGGDEVDAWGYDRDNGGPGTLAAIVDKLRAGGTS